MLKKRKAEVTDDEHHTKMYQNIKVPAALNRSHFDRTPPRLSPLRVPNRAPDFLTNPIEISESAPASAVELATKRFTHTLKTQPLPRAILSNVSSNGGSAQETSATVSMSLCLSLGRVSRTDAGRYADSNASSSDEDENDSDSENVKQDSMRLPTVPAQIPTKLIQEYQAQLAKSQLQEQEASESGDDGDAQVDTELVEKRFECLKRLATTWNTIIDKYHHTFAAESDIIDLETGELIEDNGYLKCAEKVPIAVDPAKGESVDCETEEMEISLVLRVKSEAGAEFDSLDIRHVVSSPVLTLKERDALPCVSRQDLSPQVLPTAKTSRLPQNAKSPALSDDDFAPHQPVFNMPRTLH